MWEWLPSTIAGAFGGLSINVFLYGRTRWIEMQILTKALAREIIFLTRKLDEYSPASPSLYISDDDMIVFRSNTGKIGLMEPTLVFKTVKFYSFVRNAVRNCKDTTTEARAAVERASTYGKYGNTGNDCRKGLIAHLEFFARLGYLRWLWLRFTETPLGRYIGRSLRRVSRLERLCGYLFPLPEQEPVD